MPISLVSGPPASGKTTQVIDALARVYASAPFAESVLLVPTQRHADQLRRLAAERTGAAFNLRAATIASYASELLRDAGHAILPPDVAAALLDRVAAATIARDATYFAPIRHMRGLSRLLGPAITDLLAADIDPDAFTQAAHRSTVPRLAALAAIYARYRTELETGGWLHPAQAPARAARLTNLSSPAFAAADGFRTLRAGELAFITAVISRAAEAVVTAEETLLPLLHSAIPSATVTILADRPPAPALAIGESPDRESEVRAVARLIKEKLTADPSLRPSSIAITARQAAPRLRLVRQVFREFDLPLDSAAAEPLSHRPLGAWLRRLLTLESGGWRLRDILPVLRSGFVNTRRWQLNPGHLGFVAGRARRNRIWGGPDLAQRITTAVRQAEPVSPFGLEAAAAFEAALAELHDILAPRILTPGQHAARLSEALFGSGGLVPPSLQDAIEPRAEIAALQSILLGIQAIEDFLPADPVPLDSFATTLIDLTSTTPLQLREAGGVLFAPLHTLHGLRFDHLVVLGMNEGEFPAPVSASNLLDGTHLTALAAAGLDLALPPRATEDELWKSASTRPATSLTGWRTLLDDSGRSRAPSLFFGLLEASKAGRVAVPAEPSLAASARELLVASVRTWDTPRPARPQSAHWQAIRAAATVERIRRSFTAGGPAEGDLRAAALASTVATDKWSATRFESYLTCPFQFFGHYVMRLSELDEETREADAAVRGTVVHHILEAGVQPLVEARQPINSATLPRLLKFLETEGERIWNAAPAEYGFGRAGLWKLQWPRVLGDLGNLLKREAEFSEQHGIRRVVATEMKLDTVLPLNPPVTFGGSADRVDEGDGFIVVSDYKSGKEISRKEVDEARRVQLQLYSLAAMAATGQPAVIGRYVPLRPSKDSALWEIDSRKGTTIADGLTAAQGVLDQVAARSFYVNPTPTVCPPYCSFIRACRVNQFSRSKWSDA